MGEDSSTVGSLYLDGVKIDELQPIDLSVAEVITKKESYKGNSYFKCSGTISIDVDSDSGFSKMCEAVIKSMSFTGKLLCNNWRRKHNLPLIRKGTKMYEVKKRSRKTWRI